MAPKINARAPAICFVGPLPPPIHGMANVNAAVLDRLQQCALVAVFPVMPDERPGPLGHAKKLMRALRAISGILRARATGARIFYGSVDDKLGGLYTAAFAFTARLCGMTVFLHHHSFVYVDRTSWLMRILTCAAGRSAHHIVLCNCMGQKFASKYRTVRHLLVFSNSVEMREAKVSNAQLSGDGAFTLGLLSNLSFEKGLDQFIALLERALSMDINVCGILAGPANDDEARDHIERAVQRLGGKLEWLGPVSGREKEAFFARADVFVFPTRYPSEAYPLVLVEALTAGLPVISTDRGCIAELSTLKSCTVHPRGADFVEAALPQIAEYASDKALLIKAKELAAREGRDLNARNRDSGDLLVQTIVRAGSSHA